MLAEFLPGENVPVPPVQLPPETAFADNATAIAPQVTTSGPAFDTGGLFSVIPI